MGVDFTAILDYRIDICELKDIPNKLNQVNSMLAGLWNEEIENWSYYRDPLYHSIEEEFKIAKHLDLDGPFGFSITLGNQILEIYHITRWYMFLIDDHGIQEKLRNSILEIGKILGAKKIIYLPDSLYKESVVSGFVYESKNLKDVCSWLIENCGKPKEAIKDVLNETDDDSSDYSGYYIESF